MSEPNVYSAEASAQACEAAIGVVEDNASEIWKQAALDVVRRLCVMRPKFTTDAVWYVLDGMGLDHPPEPRAMGAIMRNASYLGLCVVSNETKKSVREKCHRRPLQVWRSLQCKELR